MKSINDIFDINQKLAVTVNTAEEMYHTIIAMCQFGKYTFGSKNHNEITLEDIQFDFERATNMYKQINIRPYTMGEYYSGKIVYGLAEGCNLIEATELFPELKLKTELDYELY